MADPKACPICGKKMMGVFCVDPIGPQSLAIMKKMGIDAAGWCVNCAQARLEEEVQKRKAAFSSGTERLQELDVTVPAMIVAQTTPHFESQQGNVVGIVSGHSVIGTGPISALASAFTDFFGKESVAYQEKIRDAEGKALLMAKMQAVELGASLISGMTITVSEATSGHGMIMVTCVGTAIKTKDTPPEIQEYLDLKLQSKELQELKALYVNEA